jgi:hypothetical protein
MMVSMQQRRAFALALAAAATAAAALASCSSIPSLNVPALYSTYPAVEKDAAGERQVERFVLHRSGGFANDDAYEYLVERRDGEDGVASYVLSMRYTGNAPESIDRIAACVDGKALGLGPGESRRGYSGRYRMELVEAPLGPRDAAAIESGSALTVQYFGKYPTFPVEIPGPGLEALKAFLAE